MPISRPITAVNKRHHDRLARIGQRRRRGQPRHGGAAQNSAVSRGFSGRCGAGAQQCHRPGLAFNAMVGRGRFRAERQLPDATRHRADALTFPVALAAGDARIGGTHCSFERHDLPIR